MYYYIEPMVDADISQVQAVEQQSFSTPWSATTYRRELRNPDTSRYIVARASPVPPPPRQSRRAEPPRRAGLLGVLFANLFVEPVAPHTDPIIGYGGVWLTVDDAHITTIAVAPAQRGNGVGELLLNGLIDNAIDLNASLLTLEVRISNTSAQNLYLKYGFRPAGTRPRYYTDNGEDALIMWTDPINTPAYQARLQELRQRLYTRLRAQADEVTR